MPNGTYGGVRGKETKIGQKTFVSRPTRLNKWRLCKPVVRILLVELVTYVWINNINANYITCRCEK